MLNVALTAAILIRAHPPLPTDEGKITDVEKVEHKVEETDRVDKGMLARLHTVMPVGALQ